jgi:hypothetical protein
LTAVLKSSVPGIGRKGKMSEAERGNLCFISAALSSVAIIDSRDSPG